VGLTILKFALQDDVGTERECSNSAGSPFLASACLNPHGSRNFWLDLCCPGNNSELTGLLKSGGKATELQIEAPRLTFRFIGRPPSRSASGTPDALRSGRLYLEFGGFATAFEQASQLELLPGQHRSSQKFRDP